METKKMDNSNKLDDFFRSAREQKPELSFDKVKAQFIISSMNLAVNSPSKQKNLPSLKKWIMTFTAISSIIVAIIWISPYTASKQKTSKPIVAHKKNRNSSQSANYQEVMREKTNVFHNNINRSKTTSFQLNELTLENTFVNHPTTISSEIIEHSFTNNKNNYKPSLNDVVPMPILTEEEIAFAVKTKKQLLKAIYKHDKKEWAYIPTNSIRMQDSVFTVQSFFMLKTEVTNAQYLAFIYDLIIQNKKEAFYSAKPDQKQWTNYFNSGMGSYEVLYFSNPVFANYPVVNVSQEGAELFCNWITEEYKKMYSKSADEINPIRLPMYAEWVMAVSSSGKYTKYPWVGDSVKNTNGMMQANFARTDLPAVAESSNLDLTSPVKSYWPNDYGIYNLVGNVAEMVVESSPKNSLISVNQKNRPVRTVGGSFEKSAEFLEINAKDPYKGKITACPAIGFRIVMTYLSPNIR